MSGKYITAQPSLGQMSSADEVGFFEFETKIRKMIIDMLDPLQKRVSDDRDKIVKIRTDLEAQRRHTEDLQFAINKTDSRLVAFDDIYKKFNRLVT